MKEKERKRLQEREVDEFEGIEIAKAVRIAEEAERQVLKDKKNQVARHKMMVRESEHNEGLLKEQKRIDEKQEDDKILKYNMEKTQKEAEFVAEGKRKKDEKERETQRLREMQENATDRQGELDELRAKRAVEQQEREARKKEARDQ